MGRHSLATPGASPSSPAPATPGKPARGRSGARTGLLVALGLALLATIVGAVALWPTGEAPQAEASLQQTQLLSAETVTAHVDEVRPGDCGSPSSGRAFDGEPEVPSALPGGMGSPHGGHECVWAIATISEGPDAGKRTLIETAGMPGDPVLETGEGVKLAVEEPPAGMPGASPSAQPVRMYTFMDIERTSPLLVWLGVTVAGIVLVGAWRGMRSLAGLAVTLAVVAVFLLPALLRGGPTLPLAVVTGAIIVFLAVPLVHGVNWKSAASMAGTLLALAAATGLAQAAIATTGLRGLADEDNLLIHLNFPAVDVTGLLLTGFIIGALGVLNDVTVTQASTVTELAEANPTMGAGGLFRGAMRVGQDHIASMVYTLVLTYTGATLPLLLLITASERPLADMLTSDVVATELLRSGVGALGLVLAVPLTTAIAALTARGRD